MMTLEELNRLDERLRPFLNSQAMRVRRAPANDPAVSFRLNQEWPDPSMSDQEIARHTIDGRVFRADANRVYVSNQDEIQITLYFGARDPAYDHVDALFQRVVEEVRRVEGSRFAPRSVTVPDSLIVGLSGTEGLTSEKQRGAAFYWINGARTGAFPYGPPGSDPTMVWDGFAFSERAVAGPAFWVWLPRLDQLITDKGKFVFIFRGAKLRRYKRDEQSRGTYGLMLYYAVQRLSDAKPKREMDDPFDLLDGGGPEVMDLDDPFCEPASDLGDRADAGTVRTDPQRLKEEFLALIESNPFLKGGWIIPVDLVEKRPLVSWSQRSWPATEAGLDAILSEYPTERLGIGWIPPQGVTVVDVDALHTNDPDQEAKFYRELGYDGPIFRTRRGLHLFFQTPAAVRIGTKNRVATLLGRVDFRVGGPVPTGYIILPLGDPPRRVLQSGEPCSTFFHYPIGQRFEVSLPILEGTRNETLFRLLCSMRGTGYYESSAIEAIAEQVNQLLVQPPLPRSELRTLVRSVLRYPEPVARSIGEPLTEDALDRLLREILEPPQAENEPPVRTCGIEDLMQIRFDPLFLWMEPGQATVIKGPPKAGKTTFVRTLIDEALSHGLRVAWLCMEEGRVQFAQLTKRFDRIIRSTQHQFAISFPNQVQFDQEKTLKWLLASGMNGYHLLVIDPIGAACVDQKRPVDKSFKNDYDAVYRFILGIRRVVAYTGSHALLIHHTGKSGLDTNQSSLGSTAFDAAPDNLLQVRKDDTIHLISRSYGNHEFRTPYDYNTGRRDLTELIEFFRDLTGGVRSPQGESDDTT